MRRGSVGHDDKLEFLTGLAAVANLFALNINHLQVAGTGTGWGPRLFGVRMMPVGFTLE